MSLLNVSSILTFCINEASLTQFYITDTNTLKYKFKVKISVKNPHKHIKIYYDTITAIALYKDNEFARASLALPFEQGHKNTTFLEAKEFEGESLINLEPKQLAEYYNETLAGVYNDLAVDLVLQVRYKYRRIRSTRLRPRTVKFHLLRVPLIGECESTTPCNMCESGDLIY